MGIASGLLALFLLFALASPISAGPSPLGRASEKRDIKWQGCSLFNVDSDDPNLGCAYYEVPLDYHNTTAGGARLALVRYAGNSSQKLGTLFLNPGGPGLSGIDFMTKSGKDISSIFQGTHDIISWDPRGVGSFTIPGAVTCFDSADEESGFFQHTIIESINYTIAGNFDKQDQDELFAGTSADSSLLIDFGKRCQAGPVGKNLQYLGTSSTIRDLVSLGDGIVGPGKPIDFWGLSYGSVIGINFINMFPERAGHVILDGVIDPTSWASYKLGRPTIADASKTCNVFGDACVQAGKERCKLLDLLDPGATLDDMVKLVANGHDTAVKLLRAGYTGIPILPGQMMDALLQTLEAPSAWSGFANGVAHQLFTAIFQAAQTLNITSGGNYHIPTGPPPKSDDQPSNTPQAPMSHAKEAVMGADNFADVENNVTMKDVLTQIVNNTQTVTLPFGAIWDTGYNYGWPVRSVERLPPFNFSKTINPVLVIGNSADPRTPFLGAQNAATLLGNSSTLLEHLGSGHTSLAQVSTCTRTLIAQYLMTSKLPTAPSGQHLTCQIDPTDIFPPVVISDNTTNTNTTNTNSTSTLGNGDISLFPASWSWIMLPVMVYTADYFF